METLPESFVDVKVEVVEEEDAAVSTSENLWFELNTPAWTDDSKASVNVVKAEQISSVQNQDNVGQHLHSSLPEDPLAIKHQPPKRRKGDSQARSCFSGDSTTSRSVENLQEMKMVQYFSKVKMKKTRYELPDPYTLLGWTDSMKEWPDVNSGYIHQYLLCNQNPLSDKKTSASLAGYVCFTNGNVLDVKYHPISITSPVCFLKAKVVTPYNITAEPHEPWLCLEKTEGSINSSDCTCMTGLKEVCCHVAALLFKVEAAVSLGMNKEDWSITVSSKLAVWNKCYKLKNDTARVRDIDFSHPNKPKKTKRQLKQLKPMPLSESEQEEALDELRKILPNAIMFMKRNSDLP